MNSDKPDSEAWGQLVCVTDVNTPPVLISNDFCYIGRNSDSDICHAGNKLVSGKHCHIERDKQGKVWLYDTSTNGTLFNMTIKLSKGECREISHGDEFHLVHKKEKSEDDIGYMYQDLQALEAETSSDLEEDTQEYSFADQTQPDPNATIPDIEAVAVSSRGPSNKRKAVDDEEDTNMYGKKQKGSEEKEAEADGSKPCSSRTDSPPRQTGADDAKASSSRSDSNDTNKPNIKEPEEDAIAETLVCIICQELLHDCISLQPCMHSFCSGCYSEWMELSQECPSCRNKVERINKNHIVNNLVEAYLKVNPDKKRPEADIVALEAKNKITRDMLYPTNQVKESLNPSDNENYSTVDDDQGNASMASEAASEVDDDDYYDDDDEDDDQDDGGAAYANPYPNQFANYLAPNHFPMRWIGGAIQAVQNFMNPLPAPRPVCRQCPQYNPNNNPNEAAHQVALRQLNPADPDEKNYPTAPVFQCRPVGANHVMCFCCNESMPERTREFRPDGPVPPQQCALCYRHYCHAYWGCRRPGCHGCIAKFKDLNFGKPIMNFLLLDNGHESEILKAWMWSKNLSVKDVFAECLARIVTKNYAYPDKAMIESLNGINTPVCYNCGYKNFKELIYQYRRDIPNDDLPENVRNRPECHWGKNCRTQKSKPEHARRYNHICEQTRHA